MRRLSRILLIVIGLAVLGGGLWVSRWVCVSAWVRYGMNVGRCPEGEVLPAASVEGWGLRRGQATDVAVSAFGFFTYGPADQVRHRAVSIRDADLSLVAGEGPTEKVTPLAPREPWKDAGTGRLVGAIALPADLPDGDYRLRATVRSRVGEATVEAPLAVYAPARIHVITDRPLYEPGHTVKFRAVVLRARDLVPLDGRPGRWRVTDPDGVVVLEEEAPAGPWGVSAGELPLDATAPTGEWSIEWTSGGASAAARVQVEPFTLPRFTVSAQSVAPFYGKGERPRLRGEVLYASGAPVNGRVEIGWRVVRGDWPPPTSWLSRDLPQVAVTDARGRFELELPEVPADLQGQVTLQAVLDAFDPTGDRAQGAGSVLLSEHPIAVEAVTELDGGLAEGFNNRLYLRTTTAAGRVLRNARLVVKRAWDPTDPGTETMADDDGVAALQIDPGPPVTVVVPPRPVRPPEPPEPVVRTGVREIVGQSDPRLAELAELDRWNPLLATCIRYVETQQDQVLFVRVAPDGRILSSSSPGALGRCLSGAVKARRFPAGGARIFRLDYRLSSDLPRVERRGEQTEALPAEVGLAIDAALLDARRCLPRQVGRLSLPRGLVWEVAGQQLTTSWEVPPGRPQASVGRDVATCIERALADAVRSRKLEQEREGPPAYGVLWFFTRPAPSVEVSQPRETTRLGYELLITAFADDEELGRTELVLPPGRVPPLRLRATPVLPDPGAEVVIELLRGPDFHGGLPKKLRLHHDQMSLEAELDPDTRKARFTLPPELEGWFLVEHGGARTRLFVRPRKDLTLEVAPDRPTYRPGETARLALTTRAGEAPVAAAVGLFGVDETLGVLAPLPGPDALNGLQPQVTTSTPAFGVLEGQALVQGLIRGEHAAAATLLRIADVPTPAELDVSVQALATTEHDPLPLLTDRFYTVLEALHARVRAWESDAPKGEKMSPARMVALWDEALADVRSQGEATTDLFGRELQLPQLPDDLLALTDPRVVVVEGTRLPEDVENWVAFVRRRR